MNTSVEPYQNPFIGLHGRLTGDSISPGHPRHSLIDVYAVQ